MMVKKKDKTLVAFAGNHPVPQQQGNYLSWVKYSKYGGSGQEGNRKDEK
jgi:hypothetical protein